jgi:cytochrome bd-type quinol oxidase subunit 1
MDATALLLSRLQFAFTISFHIIFPAFTIGLAAWLTILEALHLIASCPAYRVLFEFWLKVFGVAFGLGVVSGVVMAFQFGTNWSVLAKMSGPIQGPLLSYETFTAFALEASFLVSCFLAGLAYPRGSICSRLRWWHWGPRFRRSGSWSITAGCRTGRLRGAEWRLRS